MRRQAIERLLPRVFQRTVREDDPLAALLGVMEGLHAPAEDALARLPATLDPSRTTEAFVPYLAGWVDLDRLFDSVDSGPGAVATGHAPISTGMGRLRQLVAAAAWLSQWRGTSKGLIRFLETATGLRGFAIDETVAATGGVPRPFHIRVRCPAAARPHELLVRRIVESEKPAYVTYDLVLGEATSRE